MDEMLISGQQPRLEGQAPRGGGGVSVATASLLLCFAVLSCGRREVHLDPLLETEEDALAVVDERPVIIAEVARPLAGGTLLATQSGRYAIVADSERDRISVVDLETETVEQELLLKVGDIPTRVVEDPEGRIHVVLRGAAEVFSFSVGDEEGQRRGVCPEPRGLGYSGARAQLLVACLGGQLWGLSGSEEALQLAQLPTDLRDVVVIPAEGEQDEQLFVTRFKSAELLELGPELRVVSRQLPPELSVPVPSIGDEGVSPGQQVASGELQFVPFNASVAWRAVPSRDGPVVVHQRALQDIPLSATGGYSPEGCNSLVGTGVMRRGRTGESQVLSGLSQTLATDIALSGDGTLLAVLDSARPDPDPLRTIPVANQPESIPEPQISRPAVSVYVEAFADAASTDSCLAPPQALTWVDDNDRPTAVAFNPAVRGQLLIQVREPAALLIHPTPSAPARRVLLGGLSVRDTAYALFMRVQSSGLACASCHPEGGDDGRTWLFEGHGARRSQPLNVGIAAPYHWDAEFGDMAELADRVMDRMGGFALSAERSAALESWLQSQRHPQPVNHLDPQLVQQGAELFFSEEVGCSECHGEASTKSHDVGTGLALQAPSLVGVGYRENLMHNGCAPGLEHRFDAACGGGDKHGRTSHLGEQDLAALVAYMKSL